MELTTPVMVYATSGRLRDPLRAELRTAMISTANCSGE